MGSTLGSSVEGDWGGVIDNKLSKSSSPFMVVFDEVGYYATQGMAVMAAQARSLGFSLIFASQDIPSMELRVREEARSITANCNLKIFGKLEESLDTQNFFEKTVGKLLTTESTGVALPGNNLLGNYYDNRNANMVLRDKATWADLRDQVEGEIHLTWQSKVISGRLFYASPGKVKAMRVHKLLGVRAPERMDQTLTSTIKVLLQHLRDPNWIALAAEAATDPSKELSALLYGFSLAQKSDVDPIQKGSMAIASLSAYLQPEEAAELEAAPGEADANWDDDYNSLLDDETEEVAAEPVSFADLPQIEHSDPAIFAPPSAQTAQLPSPDTEIDDILEGLVRPRRIVAGANKAIDSAMTALAEAEPEFPVHPVLGREVSAILKSAADRLASSIDFVTAGNAE